MNDDELKNLSEEHEKLRKEIGVLHRRYSNMQKEFKKVKRKKNPEATNWWTKYINPMLPVVATILLGVIGFSLTGKYNSSQLNIAKEQNNSNKQIAQINASLSFVKMLKEFSDSGKDADLAEQAKIDIAPVLPPEVGFNIAVTDLLRNPSLMDVLMKSYGDSCWQYLVPYMESQEDIALKIDKRHADTIKSHFHASVILSYLDRKRLLKNLYQFIVSGNYNSDKRIFVLVHYINYLNSIYTRNFNDYFSIPIYGGEIGPQILATISNTKDYKLKADLALAGSFVFDSASPGKFSELAAQFVWKKFDISFAEFPSEESIESYIIEYRFVLPYSKRDRLNKNPLTILFTNDLYNGIEKINFDSLQYSRGWPIFFNFLICSFDDSSNMCFQPRYALNIIEKIVHSNNPQNDDKEQIFLAEQFNDIGLNIFTMYRTDASLRKEFSNTLIEWYSTHWKKGMKQSRIFDSIKKYYPDLTSKIDKNWIPSIK